MTFTVEIWCKGKCRQVIELNWRNHCATATVVATRKIMRKNALLILHAHVNLHDAILVSLAPFTRKYCLRTQHSSTMICVTLCNWGSFSNRRRSTPLQLQYVRFKTIHASNKYADVCWCLLMFESYLVSLWKRFWLQQSLLTGTVSV